MRFYFGVILFVVIKRIEAASQDSLGPIYEVNTHHQDGGYNFAFANVNGISASEEGRLVNGVINVKGQFGYVNSVGKFINAAYIADENGFRRLPGSSIIDNRPTSTPSSISSEAPQGLGAVEVPENKPDNMEIDQRICGILCGFGK